MGEKDEMLDLVQMEEGAAPSGDTTPAVGAASAENKQTRKSWFCVSNTHRGLKQLLHACWFLERLYCFLNQGNEAVCVCFTGVCVTATLKHKLTPSSAKHQLRARFI